METEEESPASVVSAKEPDPPPDSPPEAEPEAQPEAQADPPPAAEAAEPERSDDELVTELAGLLFASPDPLSEGRLGELLAGPEPARLRRLLERLGEELAASPLPVVLRKIAGGWRLLTDPALGEVVARLRRSSRPERISAAALETLAIVAYRQPVTKAEVEAIRGVQAGPVLRSLVDRGLVRVTGRADLPGSPLLYGTTREFLERFGLADLKDLPRDAELTES